MAKHLIAFATALLAAAPAGAAAPVRTMYVQATEQEQTVRAALAEPAASEAALKSVRRAIVSYEAVVRRYPTSGYSDNALWQAARLALDAFEKFGDARDRATGLRLLQRLAAEYPTSKLSKQVPDLLLGQDGPRQDTPLGPVVRAGAKGAPLPTTTTVAVSKTAVAKTTKIALLTNIQRSVLPDVIRVTIALDAEVPFHDERLAGPSRIFIDFPTTRVAAALVDQTLRFDGDSDLVRQVRIGRHPNTTTRVVLDATGISSYSVYPVYNPYRLVIDCVRDRPVAAPRANAIVASVAPPLTSRTPRDDWGRRLPYVAPLAAAVIAEALTRPLEPAAVAAAIPIPAPTPLTTPLTRPIAPPTAPMAPTTTPTTNMGAGYSMARQLGLGVSRIVIDPGHGGHDSGAKGKGSLTEAALVLDVSLRLKKLLDKVSGLEVILTRRTDEYVPLPERTEIANREGADLFLSIHANASANDQAHGVETYFLNFANNLSAAAVAARENAASGQAMGALPDFVRAIALNNKLDESHDFATLVQESMIERLRQSNKAVKNLGVKQAPFVVLIGASMPSVLAEISFLTNAQEGKLLKSNAYRQRIAEALFTAVRKYQGSLTRVQTVAVH